jgi:quinol-cytochrome oxidoreductase complex cytochrome b subunit
MEMKVSHRTYEKRGGDSRLLAVVEGFNVAQESREDEKWVPVWPHLVFRELIAVLLVTFLLIVVSLFFDAPLEGPADPTHSPNPAKAPWYFLGLQELLVYFDPWLAGVVLPGIIILGLMAIPYLDQNAQNRGTYAFARRWFPISAFSFGLAMWFVLIAIGGVFRGPGWEWYWPWQDQSLQKMTMQSTKDLPLVLGSVLILLYFGLGLILPAVLKKAYFRARGAVRYGIQMVLLLMMIGLLGKIFLRLAFNVKYVLVTPWFSI